MAIIMIGVGHTINRVSNEDLGGIQLVFIDLMELSFKSMAVMK